MTKVCGSVKLSHEALSSMSQLIESYHTIHMLDLYEVRNGGTTESYVIPL